MLYEIQVLGLLFSPSFILLGILKDFLLWVQNTGKTAFNKVSEELAFSFTMRNSHITGKRNSYDKAESTST